MPGPATQGLNLSAVDSMVSDFMATEALVEDQGPSESNQDNKRKCEAVRSCILEGDIDAAVKLIEEVNSSILQDLRLLFRLKKQKLVELLRKGGIHGDNQALGWIRSELAPLALNAYPEAYLEFKKSLLLLVYDQGQKSSPVMEEWSMKARSELANLVFNTLRQTTGLKDPSLVMLLKYLLFIHDQYYADQLDAATESDLVDELRCSERYPAPLGRENYTGGPFPAKDVQTIVQAVGIRQQDAMESLKHADGDISAAFVNELARIQLHKQKLHELVLEYAGYRGLLRIPDCEDSEILSSMERNDSSDSAFSFPKMQLTSTGIANDMMDTDEGAVGQGEEDHAEGASDHPDNICESPSVLPVASVQSKGTGSKANDAVVTSASQTLESPSQQGNSEEIPDMTDRPTQREEEPVPSTRSASRSPPKKILKVWSKQSPVSSRAEVAGPAPLPVAAVDGSHSVSRKQESASVLKFKCDPKLALILRLLRMVKEGQYLVAMDKVSEVDGKLFDRHPHILFDLWRFEVLRIASTGAHDAALEVVRKRLTPIVKARADLFPYLQDTLSAIMAPDPEPASPSRLCSSLQTALQESLDLPGPALARLLKALLMAHRGWFRKQRCQDVFQKLLCIDVLRQGDSMPMSAPLSTGASASEGGGPPRRESEEGRTDGSHDEPPPVEPEIEDSLGSDWAAEDSDLSMDVDEEAIVQVVEFLSVSRSTAIDLLIQHDGNVETAIWNVLTD